MQQPFSYRKTVTISHCMIWSTAGWSTFSASAGPIYLVFFVGSQPLATNRSNPALRHWACVALSCTSIASVTVSSQSIISFSTKCCIASTCRASNSATSVAASTPYSVARLAMRLYGSGFRWPPTSIQQKPYQSHLNEKVTYHSVLSRLNKPGGLPR